jgi:hypothetical protein
MDTVSETVVELRKLRLPGACHCGLERKAQAQSKFD